MTVTQEPARPEGDARAPIAGQIMNAGGWAACNPGAMIPRKIDAPLEVPGYVITYGMAVLWIERVARSWDVPVTEDEDGTVRAEKRFGDFRFTATVTPGDYAAGNAA